MADRAVRLTPRESPTDAVNAAQTIGGFTAGGLGGAAWRGGRTAWFALRRAGQAALTLVLASVAVWLLDALAPGDPAQQVLASQGVRSPSAAQLRDMAHQLGLDRPLWSRYLSWLDRAVRGDFGVSYISSLPVHTELAQRLSATAILAGTALTLVVLIAVGLGLAAAATVGRWPDITIRVLTVLCAATPAFVLGLLIVQVIVVKLGLGVVLAGGDVQDVFLPALCVALGSMAVPTRVLRASVVAAVGEKYALLARARGAGRWSVLIRHGLPNAGVPLVQALALSAAWMIGGTVVVETVFTWPGVGSYLVTSVQQRDLPVVQAGTLLATAAYVVSGLVADLITGLVDPRMRGRA